MRFIKKVLHILLVAIGILSAIGLSYVGGYIVQWFVWLICFIWEILNGQSSVTEWVANHDKVVHILCSFSFLPILVLLVIVESGGNASSSLSADHRHNMNNYKYTDELNDIKKHQFSFVDASGAYRHWGDDFIDFKGNWCSWGAGFYDYDGNYIRWGNPYKDSSGAYRCWGDDFIDGVGHWVTNIPR